MELVEDESDVLAAKELKAEVKADIAEFDENETNLNNGDNGEVDKKSDELNKIEIEFKSLETEVYIQINFYFVKFLARTLFKF